jgi:hypothetical protein
VPGSPVSLGCAVILSPGASGPPDSGVIVVIPQTFVTAGGMALAVIGSQCQMVNALSGAPYMLPLGPAGGSATVTLSDQALVRVGDQIPSGPGVMTILGPPAAPYVVDGGSP